MSDHRWWHDGRGWREAFCLFCGVHYVDVIQRPDISDEPCPSPRAEGGEDEAQRILARARGETLA